MRCGFLLNGRHVEIAPGAPHATLLDFLRAEGLTGAKEGCAEGECGSCSVLMVADDDGRSAYRAVNSCLMLLPTVDGREIYTVESLAEDGHLSAVQHAMAAAGGSQCGYCTPGFVINLFAEQYRRDRVGPCDPLAMAAASAAAPATVRSAMPRDARRRAAGLFSRSARPPADASACRRWRRVRASGHRRGRRVLASSHPEAKVVAGCTDSGVEFNLRHTRWPQVMSLEAIPELRRVRRARREVRIGAAPSADRFAATLAPGAAGGARVDVAVRLADHPQPGDARRQSRDCVTDWRLGSAAAGPRRVAAPRERGGPPRACRSRRSSPAIAGRSSARARSSSSPSRSRRRCRTCASTRWASAGSMTSARFLRRWRRARRTASSSCALRVRRRRRHAAACGWRRSSRAGTAVERTDRRARAARAGTELAPLGDHRGSKVYRERSRQSLVERFWVESAS